MNAPLYDVYLTGKLADDVTPALAAQRLAALFKSTPEAMAGLITGKTQLLKRGVDKNAALKYRDALQKAGCEVAFKAQTSAVVNAQPVTAAPSVATAAAPSVATPATVTQSTPPKPAPATSSAGLQLASAGGDLLRPEEHQTVTAVTVDTSHLSLAPVGPLPAAATPPAIAPDVSYLSLAAAGGNLLSESERTTPPAIAPDTDGLSLAEVGSPLETLKSEATPVHPDLSGLELAPAGSDLLTPEQRRQSQPAPPNTDHIKLAP